MTALPLQGRPLWYELLTTDVKAAEAFYGAVVGWTLLPSLDCRRHTTSSIVRAAWGA